MNTINYEPSEGLSPTNPFASDNHKRYAFATKRQCEYLITVGERLKTKTWFINGGHAQFCLKKAAQAARIVNHYRDKK